MFQKKRCGKWKALAESSWGLSPKGNCVVEFGSTAADERLAHARDAAQLSMGTTHLLELRLLTLMHVHNAANAEADTARYWTAWQECLHQHSRRLQEIHAG